MRSSIALLAATLVFPIALQAQKPRERDLKLPIGQILMYDYDLSQVIRIFNEAGIEDMRLISTNHSGHHGVIILGRKAAQSRSSQVPSDG